MAIRVHLRPLDADNPRGSLPAARNDWRSGHADSMSARDNTIPHQMPDIRLQAKPARLFKIDLVSYLREESGSPPIAEPGIGSAIQAPEMKKRQKQRKRIHRTNLQHPTSRPLSPRKLARRPRLLR